MNTKMQQAWVSSIPSVVVTAEDRDAVYATAFSGIIKAAQKSRTDTMKRDAIIGALGGAGLGLVNDLITPKDKDESRLKRLLMNVFGGAALGGAAGAGLGLLRVPETAASAAKDIAKGSGEPVEEYNPNAVSEAINNTLTDASTAAHRVAQRTLRGTYGALFGGAGVPILGLGARGVSKLPELVDKTHHMYGGTASIRGPHKLNLNPHASIYEKAKIIASNILHPHSMPEQNPNASFSGRVHSGTSKITGRNSAAAGRVLAGSESEGIRALSSRSNTIPQKIQALETAHIITHADAVSLRRMFERPTKPEKRTLAENLVNRLWGKASKKATAAMKRLNASATPPPTPAFATAGKVVAKPVNRAGKLMSSKGGGIVGALLGALLGLATYSPQVPDASNKDYRGF